MSESAPSRSITFLLLGDPVGKQRARYSGRSRRFYTPAKTRRYEVHISYAFIGVNRGRFSVFQPARHVHVHCVFRNGTHPDCDNVLKSVLDGLQGRAYQNDKSVTGSTEMSFDPQQPRIEVTVT